MNFVHVCARILGALSMYGVCEGCLAIARHMDSCILPETWGLKKGSKQLLCAVLACFLIKDTKGALTIGAVMGCLLFACVTDCVQYQVYQFTWWLAVLLLLWEAGVSSGTGGCAAWAEILFFCVVQEALFSKLYGRADCHGFCICCICLGVRGLGIRYYLLHMIAVYLLLFYVQWRKKNITWDGRLKKPVPMLPYIVAAFAGCYTLFP